MNPNLSSSSLPLRARTLGNGQLCMSTSVVNGLLFSVPLQVEGFCQIQRRFIQRQAAQGGPQIQHVALGGTVGQEALADVLVQVNPRGLLGAASGPRIGHHSRIDSRLWQASPR